MDNNGDTGNDFDQMTEIMSSDDKVIQNHGNLDFYDAFGNNDTMLASVLDVENIDLQNLNTEQMNENDSSSILTNYVNNFTPNFELIDGEQTEEPSQILINLAGVPTVDNEQFQFITTDSLYHDCQSQIQHSVDKDHCAGELIQLDRLDNTWINLTKNLRENENRLIRRNVPRLMMIYNDFGNCFINCILQMLLNAPVFIRFMFQLQHLQEENRVNLQLTENITQDKKNFFNTLFKIVKMAFEAYQNDDTDICLLQALYSCMSNWTQQNASEFYTHLMDVVQLVADEMNQLDSYSKAFEIIYSVSIDGNGLDIKKDQVIRVSSNESDFSQYINKKYTGTIVEENNGHIVSQTYEPLPKQLLTTAETERNGDTVYYPFPTEFECCNQHYLFTSGIIHNTTCVNSAPYGVVLRRQDCVYIFDGSRPKDRFHIDYLPHYFKAVHGQVLLYTKVDPYHQYNCTFEDPLYGTLPGKPHKTTHYCKTEKLATPIQSNSFITSTVLLPVIILHPILSTFRYYMHSDFRRDNINTDIPTLNDCLDQDPLYFWPRSMFTGSFIECMLVFIGPDGHSYRSHYEFVRNEGSSKKFENPTYFSIDEDNTSNDEWFPVKLTISKSKQHVFQVKDKRKNETDEDHQQDCTCQLQRFPDGENVKIDEDMLLSFENKANKKKKRKPSSKKSHNVTPHRLSKVFDLNKLQLILRRARWLPDKERYLSDPEILFRSNAFRPVSSTTKKCNYDYRSDLLQIIELSPLRIACSNETDQCTIHLSYLIPDMYACTGLKDKHIRITILTGGDQETRVHPVYRILDKQNRVSSITFPVNEYSSILTILIVKRTMAEFQKDSKLRQTLNNPSSSKRTVPVVTQDTLETMYISPSMSSFRLQLELCHSSNGEFTTYPKATVTSQKIIDESVSQERQVLPQLLATDNAESNDVMNQLLLHSKRSFDEENVASADTSSTKCHKHM